MFENLLTAIVYFDKIMPVPKFHTVHISAEIWSASFYRATVNGLTMSKKCAVHH